MVQYIWIIHNGAGGNIMQSVCVQTDTKSEVGKYIRNNISSVLFIFQKFTVCEKWPSGKICRDFLDLHDSDENFDVYKDCDKTHKKIAKILEKYTDTQIVDELWGASGDSEHDYATITKINPNSVIVL